MKTFAKKLTAACNKLKAKRGMTLEEIATTCHYTSRQFHNWKAGKMEPNVTHQRYILGLLKAEGEK